MHQLDLDLVVIGLLVAGLLMAFTQLSRRINLLRHEVEFLKSFLSRLEMRTKELEAQGSSSQEFRRKRSPKVRATKTTLEKQGTREAEVAPQSTPDTEPVQVFSEGEALEIVTRTTRQDGHTQDTWIAERNWAGKELEQLLAAHRAGMTSSTIAIQLGVDAKDVVYGIARHVHNCVGDLEDLDAAPNHGKKWLEKDDAKMQDLLKTGHPISEVSFRLGRTQLAIVWRLTG